MIEAATRKQERAARVVAQTIDAVQREPSIRAETPVSDWAIVLGGDRTVAEAKNEIVEFGKLGMKNLGIYLRQGSYRTVATFGAKEEASEALQIATRRRKDAYIVNLRVGVRIRSRSRTTSRAVNESCVRRGAGAHWRSTQPRNAASPSCLAQKKPIQRSVERNPLKAPAGYAVTKL